MPRIQKLAFPLTLAAAALALAPAAALAETQTGTLGVSVTVASSCDFEIDDLVFGIYTSGQVADLDAAGSVDYAGCVGAELTLDLDGGDNAGGGNRGLKASGEEVLRYDIYKDAARTEVAGSGGSPIIVTADESGAGSIPLYGRIFKSQTVGAGEYTDTVSVTLSF